MTFLTKRIFLTVLFIWKYGKIEGLWAHDSRISEFISGKSRSLTSLSDLLTSSFHVTVSCHSDVNAAHSRVALTVSLFVSVLQH